jgi:hypothetical protein
MADDDLPVTIEIPIPTERPRRAGVHSISGPGGGRFYPRFNAHECEILTRACEILDIPVASFIRDVAVNSADTVVEHYNATARARNGPR